MDSRLFQLNNALQQETIRPIYLICGEETLLVKEATGLVEAVALGDGLPEFNHDRLDLADAGVEKIIDVASTQPMMGGKRVVTVKCEDGLDKACSDNLMAYAENPNPHAVLVLVAGKVEGRLKFVKTVDKEGGFHRFDSLKARDIPQWLVGKAQEIGGEIEPAAARVLVEAIGTDLLALQTNLEKLMVFVGENRPIRRNDVEDCVSRTREEVIWDLTDAVGDGNQIKALRTVRGLLEGGQNPILVVSMITRHLRQLWTVKSLVSRGCSQSELPSKAKVHPFVAKKLTAQAAHFPASVFNRQFDALYRADKDLKSSKIPNELILERLLLELIQGT